MASDRTAAEGRTPARGRTLLAAALLLFAGTGCMPLDDVMVAVFGRSMRDQPSIDPYENPQPPPENSVPFAAGNYPASGDRVNIGRPEGTPEPPPPFTQQDVVTSSEVVTGLQNPVEADPASLERGEVLYERYCAVCHSSEGIGAQAPLAAAHPMLPAFDLATGAATGYTDGYIYGIIRVGRGMMPAYGDKITHYDRWHVVNYLRRLQAEAAGTVEGDAAGAPASDAADPAGAEDAGAEAPGAAPPGGGNGANGGENGGADGGGR